MKLSAAQVYWLVTDKPEPDVDKTLVALCEFFDCSHKRSITPHVVAHDPKTATGDAQGGTGVVAMSCWLPLSVQRTALLRMPMSGM